MFNREPGSLKKFSPETLMPMPDKNFSFELLDRTVSLEDRLSKVSLYPEFHGNVSSGDIAAVTGTTSILVGATARFLQIEPVDKLRSGKDRQYNEVGTSLLIYELEWTSLYEDLPEEVSSNTVAHLLGRSKKWVVETAADLHVFPSLVDERNLVYPKSLALALRHIDLVTSPRDGWLTASEVADIMSWDHSTAERVLGKIGVLPEWRRSHTDGRTLQRYPDDILDKVWRVKLERTPAGKWRTRRLIAANLDIGEDWVKLRLQPYLTLGQEMLDDAGKLSQHYSEEVFAILKGLKEEFLKIPSKTDNDFTVTEIASRLGMSPHTVKARLKLLEKAPYARRTIHNRVVRCYDDTTVLKITQLPADLRRI